MNMLSFLGQTPTIALRNAQAECGEDAIVVSIAAPKAEEATETEAVE